MTYINKIGVINNIIAAIYCIHISNKRFKDKIVLIIAAASPVINNDIIGNVRVIIKSFI